MGLLCMVLAATGFDGESQTLQIDPAYLTIADGIASPVVNDVIQDSYGLLWIATPNGVQKYDGYKLVTFKNLPGKPTSLQSNEAWGLLEDADRNIWVASASGASRYDRRKNEFVNYSFAKEFNISPEGGRLFKIFMDSQKNLWGTTQNLELVQFDASADKWRFAKYEVPNLSQPNHNGFSIAFTEDSEGGLWFGSSNYGLMHRSKNETAFKPVTLEQTGGFNFTAKPGNGISALYADSRKTLWITTRGGVHKYRLDANSFETLKEYPNAEDEIWSNLNCILQDPDGNIWIANNFNGILKYSLNADHLEEITIAGKSIMRGHGWNITMTNFIIDKSGIFWFGTREQGLMKYDPVNRPFKLFSHNPSDPHSISASAVYGALASKVNPGIVYVGTRGGGLNIFDPVKQTFQKVVYKVIDDRFGGAVRSIAELTDGTLWLGTWGDGMIRMDQNFKEVRRYKYNALLPNTISNNQVRVIKPDRQGRLWVGTDNGLNILDIGSESFQRIESEQTRTYTKSLITEMEQLAHSDQQLGIIDQVTDIQNKSLDVTVKEAGTYFVMSVGEGEVYLPADFGWIENAVHDTVWRYVKTYYAGGAAKNRMVIDTVKLQPGTYTLRYVSDDSHSYGLWNEQPPDLSSLYGIVLMKPRDQNQINRLEKSLQEGELDLRITGNSISDIQVSEKFVWVSTRENGLNKIDLLTNNLRHYRHDPTNENSLSSSNILDIFEDSRGMIWLATDQGINRLDPVKEEFIRYSEADGLPTNLTEGILEGDNGEMWISTQNGLSQMVTNEALGKVTFINYNASDGLGGDTFIALTSARATDGRFYFGGDHGLTTFSSITANSIPPDLIISDMSISNKSILDMGNDSPLTSSLTGAENIQLSYEQNNMSFEFAALHFANPQKNQYAHILKGYDKDWIYDNRNFASYTNLDPGEYEFIMRASNAYGIWNEQGKSLKIIILPPWWKTWWAYALYVILFITGIFITDRTIRFRVKRKERERTREKEWKHAKEIEKAYTHLKETQTQLIQSEKMASLGELTAGIAHEIQNPLNFINNFSEVNSELVMEMKEELMKGNVEEAKAIADNIDENEKKIIFHGKRADGIVKGMLQHSRSSTGLKESTDINALADEYLRLAYHGLRAKDKSFNASMKTDFDNSVQNVNVVPQDLGRVILNLITNAFYAVNERKKKSEAGYEPTVSVSTKRTADSVIISVSDNGGGIPQKVVDKIFQPFFTTKPTGQGTGLGLSMSYDIITKTHGGELKVETKEGEGAVFTINLPQ